MRAPRRARVAAAAVVLALSLGPLAFGAASTIGARENDRSIKLNLIDKLAAPPGILVLGSSRAKRAEPTYLRRLTGRTAFNAGVTGGTAADAWVMTRYLADCVGARNRRYLWFVDVALATNSINKDLQADPRARAYLRLDAGSAVHRRPCRSGDGRSSSRYNPDGSYSGSAASGLPAARGNLGSQVAAAISRIRANRGRAYSHANPARLVWLEKALAFMNAHGASPVLVLNPIHPAVLAELRRFGFPARHAAARSLHNLHRRYRFTVVDAEDVTRWKGDPNGFWSIGHIDTPNMRRLLRYVVHQSGSALRS